MNTPESDHLNSLNKWASEMETEHQALDTLIAELESDLNVVKQHHIRRIKQQAGRCAMAEAVLRSGVAAYPNLFETNRTHTVNGIKFGFTTSTGRVTWTDVDLVLQSIRANLPEQMQHSLIRVNEEPIKDAIKKLTAEQQRLIGCTIEGAGEVVIVKRAAGEVEQLINKLMKTMVDSMIDAD